MPSLKVMGVGRMGVNVDKNPLELDDNELRQAQNATHEPLGDNAGLTNRPGLAATNSALSGSILGGTSVLFPDQTAGKQVIYIARGAA